MPIVHPSALATGDHIADPDDFRPDPVMLRVTAKHSDYHVTVHDAETGRDRDMWFGDRDRVHRA